MRMPLVCVLCLQTDTHSFGSKASNLWARDVRSVFVHCLPHAQSLALCSGCAVLQCALANL
jgi:hypothetical protein